MFQITLLQFQTEGKLDELLALSLPLYPRNNWRYLCMGPDNLERL